MTRGQASTIDFISQVLAPLPPHVEQADSKAYRRQLRKELGERWHTTSQHADIAYHLYRAADQARVVAELTKSPEAASAAQRADAACEMPIAAVDVALRVPAPTRWVLDAKIKARRDWRRCVGWRDRERQDRMEADWDAALAADAAQLGVPDRVKRIRNAHGKVPA
jgi:hypothetical protein